MRRVTVRKTTAQPERFVLVIPPSRPEPELTLGPFDEQVIRDELRKFGLTERIITHPSLAEHLSALKAMFDRHIQTVHRKR